MAELAEFESMAIYLRSKGLSDRGASMVEYALLIVTIALIVVLSLQALGTELSTNFSTTSSLVDN